MLTPEQEAIAQTFLVPFETPEHLRAWCHSFLDIDFPLGSIDPGSNSSPSEWLFEAYKAIQNNEGDVKPTFVVYSSRDSYKCQIKGTKVLTLNGLVNIEDIRIGDTVWSGKAWRKVTNWIDDGTKAGIKLTLRNGLSVTGSPIHRYWGMRNGEQQWIRSNELQEGDLIFVNLDLDDVIDRNGQEFEIYNKISTKNEWNLVDSIEYLDSCHFFDLTVEEDHSYWSNGTISHNTLSCAALEIIGMVHFNLTIAHMAAIESQSKKTVEYVTTFLKKLKPYLEYHGRSIDSQNTRNLSVVNKDGDVAYLTIIIATLTGSNSAHTNFMCVDEVDVVRFPQAYEEAKMIPGMLKGRFPITVMTSTRKFSFGLMQKEIEAANKNGHPVLHWNIIDITEKCLPPRHKPELPKGIRYIAKRLPLRNISPTEYEALLPEKRGEYNQIEAYAGCAECSLLPVCQMRLAHRPDKDLGGLYKPIAFTANQFTKVTPDMAEAQLLCFEGSTQILMSDGTCKSIDKINVGDMVITHTGDVKPVTEVFQRKYSGKAFLVENLSWKHIGQTIVTPEHPYFIDGKDFVSIGKMKCFSFDKQGAINTSGCYTSLPIAYKSNDKKYLYFKDICQIETKVQGEKIKIASSAGRYVPEKYEINYDFGWMLGYFLAEGYVSERDYGRGKRLMSITLCSDQRETEYHERVRSFAKECGLTTSEFPAKTGYGHTIDLYNATIATIFHILCGRHSDKKKINSILMDLNLEFLRGILEGFDAGDGTKRLNPYKELTTTSYDLACQLFTIAGRLGLCPRLTKKPHKKGSKQVYLVHYIDKSYENKQKRTRFKNENNYNLYRFHEPQTVSFSGDVYNFEVEGDHSYIANGVAVHNCWKPSSSGLIYSRFDESEGENVLTLNQAWKSFHGTEPDFQVTLADLIDVFKKKGIRFYVGGDWGYRHAYALVVGAILPSGEFWIFETLAISGLEFEDMIKYAEYFRDKYRPAKWFMDTSQPMFLKAFRKRGMPCKDFKKDVMGGIEAVRGQIVDANNRRRLKVLKTEENQFMIDGFNKHHFMTDAAGNTTQTPDDEEYADACFAPGTMITTSAGLKNIEEISCSDMVLTHTGQFKRVLGVMSRNYNGSMIQLEVSGKPDTLVTPNHMYFVSDCLRSNAVESNKKLTGQRRVTNNWEWKTPSNFHEINGIKTKTSPRTATLYPAPSFSTDKYIIDMAKFLPHYKNNGDMLESNPQSGFRVGFESTVIKRYLEVTEEIAFLVGYFVAEGSLGGNRTQICFAGHQKETSVEDILNKAMEQVGASPIITKNNPKTKGRVIYANSRALTSILKPLGKDKHKHFPEWSNLLPRECVVAMIAGYAYGDGCFKSSSQNNSAFSVGSISSSISSKVYHFMVMLGYRPNMRKARRMGRWSGLGEGGAIQSDMFIITAGSSETVNMIEDFYKNNLIKKAFETKDMFIVPAQTGSYRSQLAGIGLASNVQSVKQVHYDGMVYNLEVEDDNSYVANLSAVHNCDSMRYLCQNLFEPKKKLSAGASNPILQADKEKKRLEMYRNSPEKLYSDTIMNKISSLTAETIETAKGTNDTGTVIWDFSHPINDKS